MIAIWVKAGAQGLMGARKRSIWARIAMGTGYEGWDGTETVFIVHLVLKFPIQIYATAGP